MYLPPTINSSINLIRDIFILVLFVIAYLNNKKRMVIMNKMTLAVNIFIISLMIPFLLTTLKGYIGVAIQSAHLTLIPVLIYFSARSAQKNDLNFFPCFVRFFLYTGLSVGLISIYFYFSRPQLYIDLFTVLFTVDGSTSGEVALDYVRMMGPFFSPNVFGNYMATLSIMCFVIIVRGNRAIIYWFIFFISTANLILSFSRGSWLFEIIGLILVFIHLKGSIKAFAKIVVISILAFNLGILSLTYSSTIDLNDVINLRLSSISSSESDVYQRFGNIDNVIKIVSENPLGAGLGAGSQASYGNSEFVREAGVDVIDSYYLKVLAEGGLLGIILFVYSLLFSAIILVRKLKKVPQKPVNFYVERKNFVLISLSVLVGTVFQSVGSNPFDFIATAPFFWIFLGISSALNFK